jgi:hypothetical protein
MKPLPDPIVSAQGQQVTGLRNQNRLEQRCSGSQDKTLEVVSCWRMPCTIQGSG